MQAAYHIPLALTRARARSLSLSPFLLFVVASFSVGSVSRRPTRERACAAHGPHTPRSRRPLAKHYDSLGNPSTKTHASDTHTAPIVSKAPITKNLSTTPLNSSLCSTAFEAARAFSLLVVAACTAMRLHTHKESPRRHPSSSVLAFAPAKPTPTHTSSFVVSYDWSSNITRPSIRLPIPFFPAPSIHWTGLRSM